MSSKESFANVAATPKTRGDTVCETVNFEPEKGEPVKGAPKPLSENEVYNTWFGDSEAPKPSKPGDADLADLDKYFTGELDIKKEIEQATKCVVPVKDPALPLSSTCDPNFEKLPADAFKKDIKANCNISQDKKNILIINEYENENDMNGGKLFMGLDAYDKEDYMFATI